MNYFLILIIMGLCWGGYFEYRALVRQSAKDQQEAKAEVSMEMDKLESDNKKLTADNAQLQQELNDAQAKLVAMAPAVPAAPAGNSAAPAPALPAPVRPSNSLGTIITRDGKTFSNGQLLKVEASGITISCASGITQVKFLEMKPDLQMRFGFDPRLGAELTEAQVQVLEDQRKAIALTNGN